MRRLLLAVCCLVLVTLAIGCSTNTSANEDADDGVITSPVVPAAAGQVVASNAAPPSPGVPEAGKAAPPAAASSDTTAPAAAAPAPTLVPFVEGRPTTGRWIDVDVTRYVVQLMDG